MTNDKFFQPQPLLLESSDLMMKDRAELQPIIDAISSGDSPVGMDAVYVHAVILDKLTRIEERLDRLETKLADSDDPRLRMD